MADTATDHTTWVKVCGLTNRRDVEHAVGAGADAIGVVLYPGSPRHVSAVAAAELVRDVPVMSVVLTVDATADEVLRQAETVGANCIQPYGHHAEEATARAIAAGLTVLRPVRAVANFRLPEQPEAIPLLDTPHGVLHGGTGSTFDWEIVRRISRRYVLAGGLGPDNVAAAVAAAHPWGVDASSRLEQQPGKKDPGKVTAFIEEAKRR